MSTVFGGEALSSSMAGSPPGTCTYRTPPLLESDECFLRCFLNPTVVNAGPSAQLRCDDRGEERTAATGAATTANATRGSEGGEDSNETEYIYDPTLPQRVEHYFANCPAEKVVTGALLDWLLARSSSGTGTTPVPDNTSIHSLDRITPRQASGSNSPRGGVEAEERSPKGVPVGGATAGPARSRISQLVKILLSPRCVERLDLRSGLYAPARVCVETGDLTMLSLLLNAVRPDQWDVNVGVPLRVAVEKGELAMVQALARYPSINPNRGCPLFYASQRGDLAMVRALADHPQTNVNRFTPSHGTPPLCAAIEGCHDEVVRCLLAHPRIDPNKGYFATPMQLAVQQHNLNCVRLLASRPSVSLNRALGIYPSPLEMAFRQGDTAIAEYLLADPRIEVEETLVDWLEEENDLHSLQLVTECDAVSSVKTGRTWNRRLMLCLAFATSAVIQCFVSGRLLLEIFRHRWATEALLLFGIQSIGTMVGTAAMFSHTHSSSKALICTRFIPLCRPFEVILIVKIFLHMSTRPSVVARQRCFEDLTASTSIAAALVDCPFFLSILGVFLLHGTVGGALSGIYLLFFLLGLLMLGAAGGLWRERLLMSREPLLKLGGEDVDEGEGGERQMTMAEDGLELMMGTLVGLSPQMGKKEKDTNIGSGSGSGGGPASGSSATSGSPPNSNPGSASKRGGKSTANNNSTGRYVVIKVRHE